MMYVYVLVEENPLNELTVLAVYSDWETGTRGLRQAEELWGDDSYYELVEMELDPPTLE